MKYFLERKKVNVVNNKCVTAEESVSNSYLVSMHCSDVWTIMN